MTKRKVLLIGTLLAFVLAVGITFTQVQDTTSSITVGGATVLAQEQSTDQTITQSGQAAVKEAIAAVSPAVVRVDVTATVSLSDSYSDIFNDPFFRRFFGEPQAPQERQATSLGSGFIIEYMGEKLVLTNEHVIDSADSIRVTSPAGQTWDASVVGSDEELDIAVLKLDGDIADLPTTALGDSSQVEIGDWAIAIGNPVGMSYTVTMGIISAVDRDLEKPDGSGYYNNLIQTDAAINPGNSGGPLVNAQGEVIGINTLIARQSSNGVAVEGINFAISINQIKDVLDQLVTTGKVTRAYLGVYIQDITKAMEENFGVQEGEGVLVSDIVSGSPAEQVGIKSGDVIVKVNGEPVGSTDELISAISTKPVGSEVTLDIIRDKEPLQMKATLMEKPGEEPLSSVTPSDKESAAVERFGITVESISSTTAQRLGLQSTQGVVIIDIDPGSRADWAGLETDDVIREINRQQIRSLGDWNAVVDSLDEDASVMFTIVRDGRTYFAPLD